MNIVVTGGRGFASSVALYFALDTINAETPIMRIATGDCPTGADKIAGEWAVRRGISLTVYKADWDKYGRAAGPIRNKAMLVAERPTLVVAFPGGAGTADCVKQARLFGLRVREVS